MASYRGEFQPGHPRFPIGSQAAINVSTVPVDVSSPNIVYSSEDNEAIDTFHREMGVFQNPCLVCFRADWFSVGTTWHSVWWIRSSID
jgi:alcohol oxidase